MAERAAPVPNRGALVALRTAAIVLGAAGVNDILYGAVKGYEPLYVYLGAAVLVTLLDGVVLGTVAVAFSLPLYVLLHLRDPAALLAPSMAPRAAVLMIGVVAAGLVRAVARRRLRRRRPSTVIDAPSTPLLQSPAGAFDQEEILSAIGGLREEVRAAVAELATARDAVVADAGLQESPVAALRDELRAAERSLAASREEAVSLVGRVTELQLAVSQAEAAARAATLEAERVSAAAAAQADRLASDLARERRRADDAEAKRQASDAAAGALHQELEALRSELQKTRDLVAAERETKTDSDNLVASLRQQLDRSAAELLTERERASAIEESNAALSHEATRAAAELRERDEENERLRHELDALRAELDARRAEVREREGEVDAARSARAAARAELESVRSELDATRSQLDEQTAEVERLSAALDAERARADEQANAAAQERALRERLELDLTSDESDSDKLRARIAELEESLALDVSTLTELERSVDDHRRRADAAVAEAEAARARADAVVAELDVERRRADAAAAEVETIRADADKTKADLERERERADEAVAAFEAERARADAAMEERDKTAAEFDAKLQTIVTHLAHDHEADLGKALEEKEAARAEARSAMMRANSLQKRLDDEIRLVAEVREAAQAEIDRLRERIAALEKNPPVSQPPARGAQLRPRILVAHPDADMRMNARASLEKAGYEIVSASDGLEALRTAIAQRPHVVIADAVMPKMDGRELCQLLKSQEKTANIRVILLMRASDEPPKGDFVPDEILHKPVPLETLKAKLAALIA